MRKIGLVAVCVASFVLALGLAACSGGSGGGEAPTEGSAPVEETVDEAVDEAVVESSAAIGEAVEEAEGAVEEAAGDATEAVGDAAEAAGAAIALAATDLAGVTDTVAFGDYDAMQALSRAIQNGEKADAVVEVDGLVSNFAKGMSYSIVEENPEGSGNIGTNFVIVGVDEDTYPTDGTHVKITGKVMADETGYVFKIFTLPELVEVLE